MISKRQSLILRYLIANNIEYVSTKLLAAKFNVSVRTIKNELSDLKSYGENCGSFIIESIPSKGTIIRISDEEALNSISDSEVNIRNKSDQNDQPSRCRQIINLLLSTNNFVHKQTILNKYFIGESTFYNDLNSIKFILSKYDLKLQQKTNLGYKIEGKEVDKRLLIEQIGLDDMFISGENLINAYDVITDVFIKNQYQVEEQIVQNITKHVILALNRLRQGHPITENGDICIRRTN